MLHDFPALGDVASTSVEPTFAPAGLIDSSVVEQDNAAADARRALMECGEFCRFAGIEQERDEALGELVRALPRNASASVTFQRSARTFMGEVRPVEDCWSVYVDGDGASAYANHPTSTGAIAKVLREWTVKREVARRLASAEPALRVVSL